MQDDNKKDDEFRQNEASDNASDAPSDQNQGASGDDNAPSPVPESDVPQPTEGTKPMDVHLPPDIGDIDTDSEEDNDASPDPEAPMQMQNPFQNEGQETPEPGFEQDGEPSDSERADDFEAPTDDDFPQDESFADSAEEDPYAELPDDGEDFEEDPFIEESLDEGEWSEDFEPETDFDAGSAMQSQSFMQKHFNHIVIGVGALVASGIIYMQYGDLLMGGNTGQGPTAAVQQPAFPVFDSAQDTNNAPAQRTANPFEPTSQSGEGALMNPDSLPDFASADQLRRPAQTPPDTAAAETQNTNAPDGLPPQPTPIQSARQAGGTSPDSNVLTPMLDLGLQDVGDQIEDVEKTQIKPPQQQQDETAEPSGVPWPPADSESVTVTDVPGAFEQAPQNNNDAGTTQLAQPETSNITAQNATTQAASAADNMNDSVQNALSRIMDRLDRLESKINTVDNSSSAQSTDQQDMDALKEQISQLESQISKMSSSNSSSSPSKAKRTVAAARKPAKRITPKQIPAKKWELRGAQPGQAVIGQKGSNEMKTVSVGEMVSGIGRVTAITTQSGQWVVIGTQGKITQ